MNFASPKHGVIERVKCRGVTSLALCSLLTLLGCGDSLTQIVLSVDSDISESLIGPIQIEVIGPSGRVDVEYTSDFTAPGGPTEFPITLGLVLADDAVERGVEVRVNAMEVNGTQSLEASARTNFVDGSTRALTLVLDSACVDVPCDLDFTCQAGECVSDLIDGETLPLFGE